MTNMEGIISVVKTRNNWTPMQLRAHFKWTMRLAEKVTLHLVSVGVLSENLDRYGRREVIRPGVL